MRETHHYGVVVFATIILFTVEAWGGTWVAVEDAYQIESQSGLNFSCRNLAVKVDVGFARRSGLLVRFKLKSDMVIALSSNKSDE